MAIGPVLLQGVPHRGRCCRRPDLVLRPLQLPWGQRWPGGHLGWHSWKGSRDTSSALAVCAAGCRCGVSRHRDPSSFAQQLHVRWDPPAVSTQHLSRVVLSPALTLPAGRAHVPVEAAALPVPGAALGAAGGTGAAERAVGAVLVRWALCGDRGAQGLPRWPHETQGRELFASTSSQPAPKFW